MVRSTKDVDSRKIQLDKIDRPCSFWNRRCLEFVSGNMYAVSRTVAFTRHQDSLQKFQIHGHHEPTETSHGQKSYPLYSSRHLDRRSYPVATDAILLHETYTQNFANGEIRVICYGDFPNRDENGLSYDEYLYNVIFTILTYILPIGSMTFTYARIGLELWGSQSIGENTAGQLEGIRNLITAGEFIEELSASKYYQKGRNDLFQICNFASAESMQLLFGKFEGPGGDTTSKSVKSHLVSPPQTPSFPLISITVRAGPLKPVWKARASPEGGESSLHVTLWGGRDSPFGFRRGFARFFSWCPMVHVPPEPSLSRSEALTSRYSCTGSPQSNTRISRNGTSSCTSLEHPCATSSTTSTSESRFEHDDTYTDARNSYIDLHDLSATSVVVGDTNADVYREM
ncbi:Tachykinin-like peptides receptor 99D [Eufriesea mexicana]|uniref:Tachykinin-like peptides receptor 99D n=1 Tax=Eufriesea mexicana TaxID=516756 RepID=A0A310SPX4_9HYME|nr:Tachykinin-like peptides receptor 99D [Eufriesea mexicana]